MKTGISVIICCYNSAKRLPETLQHLLQQQTKDLDWEIVIVDNASTDNTAALACDILQQNLTSDKYKIVSESQPGLIYARKKGFSIAQFDKLLYCDDDNWLDENYIQNASDILNQHPEIMILGGKGEPVFEKARPVWFDKYQGSFAVGPQGSVTSGIERVNAVYGAGTIIRRILFDQLQQVQFESLLTGRKENQLISGEDIELSRVAGYFGYYIAWSPQLTFKHLMTEGRMNWAYLKKLNFGFGRMRLYLHAYTYTETHNTAPGQGLRLPLWADKYLHLVKQLIKYYPQIQFKLSQEGNDEVLKFYALKGEMHELMLLKNGYMQVFEQIIKLKKRIATFTAGQSRKST
ncbi:MAG TPA: glycosyltransferase [Chitinophagales bacterium]|nr:glycosyltransferase [Chitinophagales bacterium]